MVLDILLVNQDVGSGEGGRRNGAKLRSRGVG